MTFDKSRVYTALNAERLPIGSKCVFADTVYELKELVNKRGKLRTKVFTRIRGDTQICRFQSNDGQYHILAYLIESSAEPKCQPFESIKEAVEAIKKHGWWIKDTIYNRCSAVIGYDDDTVKTVYDSVGVDALFDGFVFADDGSPCGELVEG